MATFSVGLDKTNLVGVLCCNTQKSKDSAEVWMFQWLLSVSAMGPALIDRDTALFVDLSKMAKSEIR